MRVFGRDSEGNYGNQKITELGIALMSKPKLLLLDEPAAGLNPSERRDFIDLVLKVFDQGVKILMVEHNMDVVMSIGRHKADGLLRPLALHKARGYQLFDDGGACGGRSQALSLGVLRCIVLARVLHSGQKGSLVLVTLPYKPSTAQVAMF